jgi:hypothetical protein
MILAIVLGGRYLSQAVLDTVLDELVLSERIINGRQAKPTMVVLDSN